MRIIETKFFSKYYNGDTYSVNTSDFSINAVGVVQENKMVRQLVNIDVASYASYGANFDIQSNRITRLGGSFIADGFSIGDEVTVSYTPTGGSNVVGTTTITAITAQRIDFGVFNIVSGTYVDANTDNFRVYLLSPLYGFQMKYNFIENSDPVSYANFIDGTQMGWYANNVGTGVTRSTSFVTATQLGNNKSWYNGTLKVRYVQNIGHIQQFELEHEFVILPFYQDSELTNIQTKVAPTYFFGGSSLKYISSLDFRRVLSDPNSSKVVNYDNIQGSIGWFEEPFNGYSMPFSIANVAYTDSSSSTVSKIEVGELTTVSYTINSSATSFSASTKVGLRVSFLPDLAQYQRQGNTFSENFLFDTVYGIADGSTNVISSPNQIKSYTITQVTTSQITVVFTCQFTDSRLNNASNYLISCEVASDSTSNTVNDKTNLIVDTQTFEKSTDISGLWDVDAMEFELYQDAYSDNSYTNFNGWVEDSINLYFEPWLDLSKNAFLNDLKIQLVAYNPTTKATFTISEMNVPLSATIVGGAQVFNTDQVAGFNFLTKNDYNIIKFVNGSKVGNKQYYQGFVSLKIDWQSWRSLAVADTVFYDSTKPNNGLNLNSSNYSLNQGYEVRVNIKANVRETVLGVDTDYVVSNIGSKVYDYNKDGNATPVWSGAISTYNSSGANLSGALLTSGVTTIKAVYNTTGTIGTLTDYFASISLEPVNVTSKNSIKIYNATLSISGTDLIAEYQLPSSEIVAGTSYKISSRLRCVPDEGCTETLSFSAITVVSPNVISYDITTSVASGETASIVIRQNDGTIRETITGTTGANINTFSSDLSNTPVSIINYISGLVSNSSTMTFNTVNYKNGMPWWGSNTEDSIIMEYTLKCVTNQIKIYFY